MISSEFLDFFKIKVEVELYCINSCVGKVMIVGWCVDGFMVILLCGKEWFVLFILIECDMILNNRNEILILEVVVRYLYFKFIVGKLFELDFKVKIFFFIGWDLIFVYYVLD